VKVAVPGADEPMDAKLAAPVAAIFQLAPPTNEREEPVLPIAILPVLLPVPIFVLPAPVVFILVAPVTVAPPVAVNNPPNVRLSDGYVVVSVEVDAFLVK